MSLVKQQLQEEVRKLIQQSRHYASQVENAKTNAKRNLMKKRLRSNNEKVANLLVALEKLEHK